MKTLLLCDFYADSWQIFIPFFVPLISRRNEKWVFDNNAFVGSNWDHGLSIDVDSIVGKPTTKCSCFLIDRRYFQLSFLKFYVMEDILFQDTNRAGRVRWYIFKFSIASLPNPIFTSFLVYKPLLS